MLVAFSGGKDSLCALDMVVRSGTFDRVEAFFMYLVPGLQCVEAPVRARCEALGVTLHTVPHWETTRALRRAELRFHSNATPPRQLNMRATELALHALTGIGWTAWGWRRADSLSRAIYLKQIGGFYTEHTQKLYPIAAWSTRDVWAYLRARRIPPPTKLGASRTSGVTLAPACLSWLHQQHPDDYARVLEVFPFADAVRWAYDNGIQEAPRAKAPTPGPGAIPG